MDKNTMIAKVAHEATEAYLSLNGKETIKHWEELSDYEKKGCIYSVEYLLNHPDPQPNSLHNLWLHTKFAKGWVYGEIENEEKRIHPFMKSFYELPPVKIKMEEIFYAIVEILK